MIKLKHKINKVRMMDRINQLSLCSEKSIGVTRRSFTAESRKAEKLVIQWMKEAGMIVRRDALNNIIGRYEGRSPGAPVLMVGSHLDTVIDGGKFDGMLGVIAAIEVVHTFNVNQHVLEHPIEAISFCDEEGVRFHTTFLGSRAITGKLTLEDLESKDENGILLAQAMENCGLDPQNYHTAKRSSDELLGYLELHIEQGPILEKEDQPCGVVTGIAGVSRYSFVVEGKAGHAGTVPMSLRKDALVGTAEIMLEIEKIAAQYKPIVITIGKLIVMPGASNVIPGLVTGTLDIRDLDYERNKDCMESIFRMVKEVCDHRVISCEFKKVMDVPPVKCSEPFIRVLEDSIQENGLRPVRMVSGAGHDAMAMADISNIGMIFVRCKDGVSHCPEEFVTIDDMETATKVLLDSIIKLTEK